MRYQNTHVLTNGIYLFYTLFFFTFYTSNFFFLHFQTKLHSFLLDILKKHDDFIDIYQITSALKTYK